ncbi:MAG: hypothetical protein FWH57_13045 [Oscillospiraceae bacterium]|nr:hypothetical protein [Oscillospiraceae bacterium]
MMIEKLACKLGRNDEVPNIELAEYLCQSRDVGGIIEIVDGFKGSDKAVANDCIKVLYEIGERKPALICDYADEFISGLYSKNNRVVWGCMMALVKIVHMASQPIYEKLDAIVSAYENGSTITVDNSISVFAGLCKASDEYENKVLPILLTHLKKCRPKEVAQHAERCSVCFNSNNAAVFIEVLEYRNPHLMASQQTRANKLLKKLYGLRQ